MLWVPVGFQNIEIKFIGNVFQIQISKFTWKRHETLLNVNTIIIILCYGNHSTHLTLLFLNLSYPYDWSQTNNEIPQFYFNRKQSQTNGNTFSSQTKIVCFVRLIFCSFVHLVSCLIIFIVCCVYNRFVNGFQSDLNGWEWKGP